MRISRLFYFSATLLLFVACEEVVDLDIAEEPSRLVVNFIMEDNADGFLELSQSRSVLATTNVQPVSDATITLRDGDGNLRSFEETEVPGIYSSPFSAEAGKTYTVRAEKEGFEPVEAVATIPFPIEIKRLSYDTTHLIPNNDTLNRNVVRTNLRLHLEDPRHERNYYAVLIRQFMSDEPSAQEKGGTYSQSGSTLYLSSDDLAIVSSNSELLQSDGRIYGKTLIFDDHLFDGTSHTVHLELNAYFHKNATMRGLEVNLLTEANITTNIYDLSSFSRIKVKTR